MPSDLLPRQSRMKPYRQTPARQLLDQFTLRPAHDRGLFACRAAAVFRTGLSSRLASSGRSPPRSTTPAGCGSVIS